MAAKSLEEAILNSNIKEKIRDALCVGPMLEVISRIDAAEERIISQLKGELRDYFAHRVMLLSMKTEATAKELFDDVFKNIKAFRDDK